MSLSKDLIFRHMEFVRQYTLRHLETVTESVADQMPPGFNNTIRWNLGHVLVSHEGLLLGLAGEQIGLPEELFELFDRGTGPSQWKSPAPTIRELEQLLAGQPGRIRTVFAGRPLSDKMESPLTIGDLIEYQTVGEVLGFALFHEAVHIGVVKGLRAAIGGAQAR